MDKTTEVILPLVANLDAITQSGYYRLPGGGTAYAELPAPGNDDVRRFEIFDAAGNLIAQRYERPGSKYERKRTAENGWAAWLPVN